jgi:hypothetical protein
MRWGYRTIGIAVVGVLAACTSSVRPSDSPLALGRWTGGGACLAVAEQGCNLTVGCGHGQFARPTVRRDGTFDIDGTYRIEVGPIGITPAPPAHFAGTVDGSTVILRVTPSDPAIPPATYTLAPTSSGFCTVPCV